MSQDRARVTGNDPAPMEEAKRDEEFLCPACFRRHKRHDEQCRQFRIERQRRREREMEQWKKERA